MSDLNRKTVLITGVSSGLGRAMAQEFNRQGFRVAGISRSKPEKYVDLWIKADITNKEDLDSAGNIIKNELGRLDVLINNAGIGGYEKWENLPEDELRTMFEINFFAPVRLTNMLLPMLREREGAIINIASIAAKLYVPCMGAYCASKAALNLYSDSLRAELISSNIHVLKVMPGRINTGFSSRAVGSMNPPETPSGGSSEQKFAEKVFKACLKKKRFLIYPWWYSLFLLIPKLIPGLYDRKNNEMWGI